MFQATRKLWAGIVGHVADADGWAGPMALATVPVVPAVLLAEGVGAVVGWARRTLAAGLRSVANVLDPVAAIPVDRVERVLDAQPAPVLVEAVPVVLTMPAAAQVTVDATTAAIVDMICEDCGTVPPVLAVESVEAKAIAECGSVRAAARSLGIAESTLRGRLKKQGVQLPKRR